LDRGGPLHRSELLSPEHSRVVSLRGDVVATKSASRSSSSRETRRGPHRQPS
jgi:hypothetical protein